MITAVADTHEVIWYFFANPKLSYTAKEFMDAANAPADKIGVYSLTLVEMVYLIEKGRIPGESFTRLAVALDETGNLFTEIALDLHIARALSRVDSAKIPDMPDRIVAATAFYLNIPVISKDGKIRLSGLMTIW